MSNISAYAWMLEDKRCGATRSKSGAYAKRCLARHARRTWKIDEAKASLGFEPMDVLPPDESPIDGGPVDELDALMSYLASRPRDTINNATPQPQPVAPQKVVSEITEVCLSLGFVDPDVAAAYAGDIAASLRPGYRWAQAMQGTACHITRRP